MNYKVSAKLNGKWWTFGTLKKNQYGNLQLSFKNTPQLKELFNSDAEWFNFSLFEDDKAKPSPAVEARAEIKKLASSEEIPF